MVELEKSIPTNIDEISQQAKELPDIDKLALFDELPAQLDRPDPELDSVWIEEAGKRRQAYREVQLQARDYEDFMERFARI